MDNLLVDQRDQKFVLHEMFNVEQLSKTSLYDHISKELIDDSLDAALKLAVKESYPIMVEADRQGCRLENGNVRVPQVYHRLKEHYCRAEWPATHIPRDCGGLGFPMSLWGATFEVFTHNLGLPWNWSGPFSGSGMLVLFGSEEQKAKYLPPLVSGQWGSALACCEEQAGTDPTLLTATAVRQPDGSYRVKGSKPCVSVGDSDLFENIIICFLARIEGDPADESGLSLFIIPKYPVKADGSLGPRNDYEVVGVERKLGTRAFPTISINFGENGNCYAELLGERGQAMGMLLQLLHGGDLSNGMIGTGIASAAYLHSLDHARNRVQGAHISQAGTPGAPRVAIINHPFVRRLLLWMKSHVEGMRALTYYSCLCLDKGRALMDPAEQEKWLGLKNVLSPILRAYSADRGFKVAEAAIQVHARYGYWSDYPVQQFLRDITPLAWWELGAGVHTLLYVTQTMGQRDGQDFANLLQEMNHTLSKHRDLEGVQDLAEDLQGRVNLLAEMGRYAGDCFKTGKAIVPIAQGTPLMLLIGDVCVGWLLFWQACLAVKRLGALMREQQINPQDATQRGEFLSQNREAAFYDGKLQAARYFIKNVLPQADSLVAAIKNEDLSLMTIHEESF